MAKVRINYRFLLKLLVLVSILGMTLGGIYWFQSSRNSHELLRQAREARESERYDEALRLYARYLSANRNSVEASAEVGELLAKLKLYERAFFNLESALRKEPTLDSARRALVDVTLGMQRYADAKSHLEKHLLKKSPEDGELLALLGRCELGLGNFEAALAKLSQANQLLPADPEIASALADLKTKRFNDPSGARLLLDGLVEKSPADVLARVARGRWLLERSAVVGLSDAAAATELQQAAWSEAQEALKIDGMSPAAALLTADAALAGSRSDEARDVIAAAITKNPRIQELYGSAAQIELANGRPEAAIEMLKKGLQAMPGSLDLMWNLAQFEASAGNLEAADKLIKELNARGYAAGPVQFLEARLMATRGRWRAAASLLEATRAKLDRSDDLLKQADFILSQCYANLGNTDQELVTLRRVIGMDPTWAVAREALVNALARSGRMQEALENNWQLANSPKRSLSSLTSLARLLLIEGLRSGGGYDWTSFKAAIDLLEQQDLGKSEAAILRAEFMVVQGDNASAESLLKARIEVDPKSVELRSALISLLIRQNDWDQVVNTLNEAKRDFGDVVTMRVEEANYLVRRYDKEVDTPKLLQLAEPVANWSDLEKAQLASSFSQLFLSLEDYPRAESFARQVAESKAGERSLAIHLLLFDIALRTENTTSMLQTLNRVREIEGDGPLWKVGEAVRLCVEAKQTQNDQLNEESLKNLAEAAVQRPNWAKISAIRAAIYEERGLNDQATAAYLEAINLGDRSPRLVSQAIKKLFDQKRYVEADEVIRKLEEQRTAFSTSLTQTASAVSLELENFDRALALAIERANRSGQPEDRLWLAQVYGVTGDYEAALREFEAVIAADSSSADAWIAMVQALARRGDRDAAIAVIERASTQLPEESRPFALAQCYEAIRDYSQAELNYSAAVTARPNDAVIVRSTADFYMRSNKKDEALPLLEKMLKEDWGVTEQDQAWARRNLALSIGLEGSLSSKQRSLELLETNLGKSDSVEDRRTKAIILGTQQDRSSIGEAIGLLEEIVQQSREYSLSDNFLLAELYRTAGDLTRHNRTMQSVLGNGGTNNSQYLRAYADSLLTQRKFEEAQVLADKLKSLAPDKIETATVEIELLFHAAEFARLIKLLEEQVANNNALAWAAEKAEDFGRRLIKDGKEAESAQFSELALALYRQVAEQVEGRANAEVTFLARQGKVVPAVQLLMSRKPVLSLDAAFLIQGSLQSGKIDQEGLELLVKLARYALKESGTSLELRMALGDLFSWAGRGPEAATEYREVLKINNRYLPALNNLAMVLALTNQNAEEALQAIQQSIQYYGPLDFLLDTRGTVLLAADKPDLALADFQQALSVSDSADRHFHVAQAYHALGRTEEARDAFQQAIFDGNTAALHPLELPMYEKLKKEFQK